MTKQQAINTTISNAKQAKTIYKLNDSPISITYYVDKTNGNVVRILKDSPGVHTGVSCIPSIPTLYTMDEARIEYKKDLQKGMIQGRG